MRQRLYQLFLFLPLRQLRRFRQRPAASRPGARSPFRRPGFRRAARGGGAVGRAAAGDREADGVVDADQREHQQDRLRLAPGVEEEAAGEQDGVASARRGERVEPEEDREEAGEEDRGGEVQPECRAGRA